MNQTVGGLSLAILLTLVIFAYGYPYTVNTEEEAKAPFGEDTKLFWNIFVGLTALVLILVVVVGFVAPCGGRAPSRVVVTPAGFGASGSSAPQDVSFMSTSLSGGDSAGGNPAPATSFLSTESVQDAGPAGPRMDLNNSDLQTPSEFSTFSRSLNDSMSFSSEDISTSLHGLSDSLSSLSMSI